MVRRQESASIPAKTGSCQQARILRGSDRLSARQFFASSTFLGAIPDPQEARIGIELALVDARAVQKDLLPTYSSDFGTRKLAAVDRYDR
jgi:hypothetical protein